jgi:hypothetical protein
MQYPTGDKAWSLQFPRGSHPHRIFFPSVGRVRATTDPRPLVLGRRNRNTTTIHYCTRTDDMTSTDRRTSMYRLLLQCINYCTNGTNLAKENSGLTVFRARSSLHAYVTCPSFTGQCNVTSFFGATKNKTGQFKSRDDGVRFVSRQRPICCCCWWSI